MKNLHTISSILEKEGISNGCGGKGGTSFTSLLNSLESLPIFNKIKGEDLFSRIKCLCSIHDLLYDLGGNSIIRYLADVWLVVQIFLLIYWVGWKKYIIVGVVYFGLRKYGKKYFNTDT